MRTLFLILGLVAASSCGATASGEREFAYAKCHAGASRELSDASVATAYAMGPDCSHVTITTTVWWGGNQAEMTDVSNASPPHITTAAELEHQMQAWLSPANAPATSSGLPEWPPSCEDIAAPRCLTPPRYFRPVMSREWYARVRADNVPLFCYGWERGTQICYARLQGLFEVGRYEWID